MAYYLKTDTRRSSRTRESAYPRFSQARLGLRFYSPSLGRWISRDLIGEQGGMNLYRLARNRPVDEVDTLGAHEGEGHPLWGCYKEEQEGLRHEHDLGETHDWSVAIDAEKCKVTCSKQTSQHMKVWTCEKMGTPEIPWWDWGQPVTEDEAGPWVEQWTMGTQPGVSSEDYLDQCRRT